MRCASAVKFAEDLRHVKKLESARSETGLLLTQVAKKIARSS